MRNAILWLAAVVTLSTIAFFFWRQRRRAVSAPDAGQPAPNRSSIPISGRTRGDMKPSTQTSDRSVGAPASADSVLAAVKDLREFVRKGLEDISFALQRIQTDLDARKPSPLGATVAPRVAESVAADDLAGVALPAEPLDKLVEEYCRGGRELESLVQAAVERGLMWGSGFTPGNRRGVETHFNSREYSIYFFQSEPGSETYLSVIRNGAPWSMDLVLVFDPEGSSTGQQAQGSCRTRQAAVGSLDPAGHEIKVTAVGRVEVS